MKKILLYISFCLVTLCKTWAQDPMYSQVLFNKMVYNPAYTGNALGVTGLVAHRNQWTAVPSRFNTSNVEITTVLPQLNAGVGGMIQHNVEGAGKLRSFSFDLTGSKLVPVINRTSNKMFTYFGLGASVNSKSVRWDNLVFGDQLDPVNGITGDQSLAQTPANQSHIYPDFNTGVAVKGMNNGVFYDFGVALDHILMPNESIFQTADGRLPRKYVFNSYLGLPFNKIVKSAHPDYFFVPGFALQSQKGFRTAIVGANIFEKHFATGLWYKSQTLSFSPEKNDALIINAAMMGDFSQDYHYKISYSYDVTINKLVSNTAGTHEITLILTYYSKQKYQSQKYSKCATLEGPSELSMPFVW